MKKIIERIVDGPGAPSENDLWLNGTTLKKYENGEWKSISGGGDGSGSGSGSGCDCPTIEANPTIGDSDTTTPLENLKVGTSIYSVSSGGGSSSGSSARIYVRGNYTWNQSNECYYFIPDDDEPTLTECLAAFKSGSDILLCNTTQQSIGGDGRSVRASVEEEDNISWIVKIILGIDEGESLLMGRFDNYDIYWDTTHSYN